MLKKIVEQVADALRAPPDETNKADDREHAVRLATAILMIDVARADHDFDESENELLLSLIAEHFGLTADEAGQLANAAGDEAEELVSLHRFTQLLNEELNDDEKSAVVKLLWRVAYADGRLNKFENSLVLKIGDLLYVNRARVMRLKHDTQQEAP